MLTTILMLTTLTQAAEPTGARFAMHAEVGTDTMTETSGVTFTGYIGPQLTAGPTVITPEVGLSVAPWPLPVSPLLGARIQWDGFIQPGVYTHLVTPLSDPQVGVAAVGFGAQAGACVDVPIAERVRLGLTAGQVFLPTGSHTQANLRVGVVL